MGVEDQTIMARLIGDRLMPEAVQSRRRSLRTRVSDIREPLRSRREDMIPGPDLIGTAERQFMNLRRSFVERDSVIASLRGMMEDDEGDMNGNGEENGGENEDANSRGRQGETVRA